MNTEPITRFILVKDVVTHFKTLETAAEEANDYEWMRAGDTAHICKHGDQIYPVLLKEQSTGLEIACGCPAWQYAHDNDGCKHVAVFLKRSTPPQKQITDEIARDLMAAGWTGGKGNLQPPETTSDEDGGDNEGSDPVPDRAPKPTPPPEPEMATQEATVETQQNEEPKMDEKKKIYTHPDGREFETAEALLDYAEKQELEETAAHNSEESALDPATFIAPMIKNLGAPQLTEAGGIRIGKKRSSGKGAETFDHFIFTLPEKDLKTGDFLINEEMTDQYGDNCRELPVRLLSDDITECFTTFYAKYGAGGIQIRGDGENWAVTNTDGSKTYIKDPTGEHGFLKDKDVKPHGILTVLVDGQNSVGTVYRFRTTGWNSIKGILASLALCAEIAKRAGGRIAFMPMMLVYRTKEVTPKGERYKKTIPVITVEFRGTIEALQERSKDATKYLSAAPDDPLQMSGSIGYDPDAETSEEMEDVRAEFYPEVEN